MPVSSKSSRSQSRWQQREDGDFPSAYRVSVQRRTPGAHLDERTVAAILEERILAEFGGHPQALIIPSSAITEGSIAGWPVYPDRQ